MTAFWLSLCVIWVGESWGMHTIWVGFDDKMHKMLFWFESLLFVRILLATYEPNVIVAETQQPEMKKASFDA